MATSGTTAFNPDILELIEEAYELVGKELRSGYDLKTARRSLNMLLQEWSNRGINFWTIEPTTVAIASAETSKALESDTVDILDASWRTGSGTSQQDRTLSRMSMHEWAHIANKTATGTPSQFWVNRISTPVVYFWPVPSEAATLVYYKVRKIEEAGAYGNTVDLPSRFLPAVAAGLAYYLAIKTPEAESRITFLKQHYEEQYAMAADEDRERASLRLVPRIR